MVTKSLTSARVLLPAIALLALVAVLLYPYVETGRISHEVTGIDVSHYQGVIDWPRVARAGVAFAYIKATEGGDYVDKDFASNWQGAAAAGIPRGAYHFFKPCKSGSAQAKNFMARVPKDQWALPPVLDVEDTSTCVSKAAPSDVVAEIGAFLEAVEAHYGCRPLIYTTPEYEAAMLGGKLEGERFWARSIHVPPMYRQASWVLWQYHHMGRRDGIDGPVDLNAFRGSRQEFERFARGETCARKF